MKIDVGLLRVEAVCRGYVGGGSVDPGLAGSRRAGIGSIGSRSARGESTRVMC